MHLTFFAEESEISASSKFALIWLWFYLFPASNAIPLILICIDDASYTWITYYKSDVWPFKIATSSVIFILISSADDLVDVITADYIN